MDRKIRIAEENLRSRSLSMETTAREQRNPVFAALSISLATLVPGAEGMAAQLREVQQQRSRMGQRAIDLRSSASKLDDLLHRRQTQSTLVQELASNAARAQAQATASSIGLTDLRWITQSPTAWPSAMRLLAGGLGAIFGFFSTLAVPLARGKFRPTYGEAAEVERHVAMPRLANIVLDDTDSLAPLPPGLVERLLRGQPVLGIGETSPIIAIHLIGTDMRDGTGDVARRLAKSIASVTGRGALLAELGKHGHDYIESFLPDPPAPEPSCLDELEEPAPAAIALPVNTVQQVACANELVTALMDGPYHYNVATAMQLLRLRAAHRVLLIASRFHTGTDFALNSATRPNVTVLVLHAEHANKADVARLCQNLAMRNADPIGFIFTQNATLD
jgi:hypothetical protein